MARRRRTNVRWPKYVSISKNRIVWRPYLGRDAGRTLFGPEVVLFHHTDVSDAEVWDRYNSVAGIGAERGTVEWMLDKFVSSKKFARLSERTQQDYKKYRDIVVSRTVRGGRFGDVNLRSVTLRTINSYLSSATAPVQANRQMAMMSSAWNWVAGEEIIPPNPIPGCRWNPEKPRERYVTDREFQAVLDESGPHLRVALEIIYLCRLRKCEALDLNTSTDLVDDGLLARRRKGSKTQIIELSDRLLGAIDEAKALHGGDLKSKLLITSRGTPFTSNGLPSSLRGACERAIKKGTLEKAICLHDLKRKGVSDFEGTETEKLDSAGHRDRRTAEIYNVKPGRTRSTR